MPAASALPLFLALVSLGSSSKDPALASDCPLDFSWSNFTLASSFCSDQDEHGKCCRYINAFIAISIAHFASTTGRLGVPPAFTEICLNSISENFNLLGIPISATSYCGLGPKIRVSYQCEGRATVLEMMQSPNFIDVIQTCKTPLSLNTRCKQCLNSGIIYLHHLTAQDDNVTLSVCRDALFVTLANQGGNFSAIDMAACFYGVQGFSIVPGPSSQSIIPIITPSSTFSEAPKQQIITTTTNKIQHTYHLSLVIRIGVGVIALTVFLLLILIQLIRKNIKELKGLDEGDTLEKSQNTPPINIQMTREGPSTMLRRFTYKEIKLATDNFRTAIGKGGFGTVYKAQFADGSLAAVKLMKNDSKQDEKDFTREIELLARLHHRHLVALNGFCIEKNERLLVYEYMENGSLKDHLHSTGRNRLRWMTRLQIANDVANALEYLHFYCDPPLCHRDIKSSNILLDENFVAKVADFGFAHASKSGAVCFEPVNTDIRGTPGYIDPEYVVTQELTEKSADTNPLVRAWALRTMAGIRLHAVAPLVLRAITKCARDPSAYVRKCAAYALPKLYDLHHDEDNSSFDELVDILLNDHCPGVVGAAAAAFKSVCPSSLFLIAKSFRRLCETLPDVEEWGQIVLIEILLRYIIARHGLVKESIMFSLSTMSTTPAADGFATFSGTSGSCHSSLVGTTCDLNMITLMCKSYIDGQIECFAQTGCSNSNDDKLDFSLTSSTNDDVVMLLRCTSPLLWSHNSAVVLAAAGVHWIMAPRENIERIIKPLLFILRSCQASKYVILCNLLVFAKAVPPFFSQYYEDFFVCSSDTYQIRALKLEILSIIATESSIPIILQEFQDYIKDPDRRFVADTVAAIGLCAQRLPIVASACLEGLLAITFYESSLSSSSQIDGEAGVLVQAIMSIKAIIKQNPDSYDRVIVQLACNLDRIKIPAARALVIWIIGEYSVIGQIIPKIVPSILNYLAWSFTSEEPDTKLQILNTAAKVLLCAQGADSLTFRKILSYFIELAKCDINYDVRDRAHFIFKFMPHILMTSSEKDNDSDISENGRMHHDPGGKILNGRMHSTISSTKSSRIYLPGSLSQIVLHAAPGYEPLPKPCSLLDTDLTAGVVNDTNESDLSSGSSIEESGSVYDSHHSSISSDDGNESANDSNDTEPTALAVRNDVQDVREKTLVDVSNANVCVDDSNENTKGNLSAFISTDLAELMPKLALESWLDEEPGVSSVQTSQQASSGRISINNLNCTVTPKLHTLLDPTISNGLRVEYAFSYEISTISSMLVLVEIFFENSSSEPIKNIALKDGESSSRVESSDQVLGESESLLRTDNVPPVLSTEEIASLDPGQRVKKLIEIRFPHHLLPLKLAVTCNGKKFSTKLWPDIGYFLKPLSMNMSAFIDHERQLPGMFEYSKRCTFKDHIEKIVRLKDDSPIHSDKIILLAQILTSKVLSNCNVSLVCADIPVSFNIDDASGLCLRFSGELLSNSKPCLISILVEGKFSEPLVLTVKINCEETVFGLNLLNRVATFLQ